MPQIKVPLTALFNEKSQSSVWVVENGAVKLVPVTVGGVAGNELLLTSGVKEGQTVVTAGVNLLAGPESDHSRRRTGQQA